MLNLFKVKSLASFFLLFFGLDVYSQSYKGLIFGDILMKSGETYTGEIRWDDEQAIWEDLFIAVRSESPTKGLLSKEQASKIKTSSTSFDFDFMQLWADKTPEFQPSFSCSFGDISYLKSTNTNIVLLGLKNGSVVKLDYNKKGDLDDRIILFDKSKKKYTLYLKDIRSIKFRQFDKSYKPIYGAPMYAKVLTSMGVYEGFFIWDMEEHLENDHINGRKGDTKIKIRFRDIAEIKAQGDGSLITLIDGKTVFLNRHDDVDKGNRGIMIMGLPFGKIRVEWKNFISASFIKPPKDARSITEFPKPNIINGLVETKNGNFIKGQLIFGLNEVFNNEFLNGSNSGFKYYIPFFRIAKIEPQNDKFSLVTIKTGSQYLLGGENEVTSQNKGVVVKGKNGKVDYINWRNIKAVNFD